MNLVVVVTGPPGSGRRRFVGAVADVTVESTGNGFDRPPPGLEGGRVRLTQGVTLHLTVVDPADLRLVDGPVLGTVVLGDLTWLASYDGSSAPLVVGVPPGTAPDAARAVGSLDPAVPVLSVDVDSRASVKAVLLALLDRAAAAVRGARP